MSVCSVAGCGRPHSARGWCARHYNTWYKHGDALYRPPPPVCGVDGCDRPYRSSGWCDDHYRAWRDHGDPLYVAPPSNPANPWAYRHPCPSCGEAEWTLPYDPAEPLWHCIRVGCDSWFTVELAQAG